VWVIALGLGLIKPFYGVFGIFLGLGCKGSETPGKRYLVVWWGMIRSM